MERQPEVTITPHDHRYGFQCYVLEGRVQNTMYHVTPCEFSASARWARLGYDRHTRKLYGEPQLMAGHMVTTEFNAGQWYSMRAKDFHSIAFSQGTRVLFVEGTPTNE